MAGEYVFIYSLFPDAEKAREAARALLEERLIACANILPQMESIYWWEGRIDDAKETALIAKTRKDLFEKAKGAIQRLHPYSCPCIIALPIEAGHTPFLQWIDTETKQ